MNLKFIDILFAILVFFTAIQVYTQCTLAELFRGTIWSRFGRISAYYWLYLHDVLPV